MKAKRSINITSAIFLGLALGILFGLFMPGRYEFLLPAVDLVSGMYMNALRMMIYPLVFCSLIIGIHSIGSISATGRIGVFCSIASVIYANGTETIVALGAVLAALYLTMFLYVLIVYGGVVKLIGRCGIRTFFA